MRSTPHAQQKTPISRRTKLANGGIIALTAAIGLGLAGAAVHNDRLVAANAASATDYTPRPVDPTLTEKPVTTAFLGDSYTSGAGTTMKFNRWSTVLSNERKWIELNYGVNGTNFGTGSQSGSKAYAERLTDIILSHPDIVIVSTSGSNLNKPQEKGITQTFEGLREGLPNARIVAISPFHELGDYPEELAELGEDIEAAVEAVDGEYLDIGSPLDGHPGALADDGGYPNDKGHEMVAEAISAAMD